MPLLDRRIHSESDTPLEALYRIHEHVALDAVEIRNEFETLWYHSSWAVRDIPDPREPDPERYACLACIPKLLCLAFNERIGNDLPRDAPPIFTGDMMEEWKKRVLKYEESPPWVEDVSPVENMLAILHWDNNNKRDFVPLGGFEDERVSPEFAGKNISIWQPHVHFM